jgi:hypothetical protein
MFLRRGRSYRELVQMRTFMPCGIGIVTAYQLHKFLRMHFVAVRAGSVLLWHWAGSAAVIDDIVFLRQLSRYRAHVGRDHGQLLCFVARMTR